MHCDGMVARLRAGGEKKSNIRWINFAGAQKCIESEVCLVLRVGQMEDSQTRRKNASTRKVPSAHFEKRGAQLSRARAFFLLLLFC